MGFAQNLTASMSSGSILPRAGSLDSLTIPALASFQ